jgi:TolB-like protein/tetratricopeptide (TPR) repeat protein
VTEQRIQRRLAAILAADVAGYSRLMGRDEEGTHSALKVHLVDLVEPCIAEHVGRVVKRTGDGLLAEFASVVDATRCAIAVQTGMHERNALVPTDTRIEFRIGVNVGDIIIDKDDIYGDGVNIAARLEALAEPGGVCVSGDAYRHIRNRLDLGVADLGEHRLKNIDEPVRVYSLRLMNKETARMSPSLPDKPSVAVLPFQNLSSDPEQEYFADGVVEDIITALAHFRDLFVIARNSSFTYKGRTVDVKQVGRELGVRYVVEGSVRRAGDRLRIVGQLIDASTGAHLWADRFDGTLAEVFDLQDQVASSIVGAITPRVEEAEIERAKRKPTESLQAYDYYLRGLAIVNATLSRDTTSEALRLFNEAIARDPEFALAYGKAARCYSYRKLNGWMVDRAEETAEATRLARRAVDLARGDAAAFSYGGFVLGYVGGDLDDGVAFIDQALVLNPNLADAWGFSGWARMCLGEPDSAIDCEARAMRLSPLDPQMFAWQFTTGLAHFCAERYDDALSWVEKVRRQQPNYASAMRLAAAGHALTGRPAEARRMIARVCEFDPTLRLSNLADVLPPFRRPDDRARYVEALRRAGLPQ